MHKINLGWDEEAQDLAGGIRLYFLAFSLLYFHFWSSPPFVWAIFVIFKPGDYPFSNMNGILELLKPQHSRTLWWINFKALKTSPGFKQNMSSFSDCGWGLIALSWETELICQFGVLSGGAAYYDVAKTEPKNMLIRRDGIWNTQKAIDTEGACWKAQIIRYGPKGNMKQFSFSYKVPPPAFLPCLLNICWGITSGSSAWVFQTFLSQQAMPHFFFSAWKLMKLYKEIASTSKESRQLLLALGHNEYVLYSNMLVVMKHHQE